MAPGGAFCCLCAGFCGVIRFRKEDMTPFLEEGHE